MLWVSDWKSGCDSEPEKSSCSSRTVLIDCVLISVYHNRDKILILSTRARCSVAQNVDFFLMQSMFFLLYYDKESFFCEALKEQISQKTNWYVEMSFRICHKIQVLHLTLFCGMTSKGDSFNILPSLHLSCFVYIFYFF